MGLGGDQPLGTWSKSNLRANERNGWTRGRDGWSGVGGEVSSNLTFSLSPGWAFVETEGWRADLEGGWVQDAVQCGADKKGGPGADEGTSPHSLSSIPRFPQLMSVTSLPNRRVDLYDRYMGPPARGCETWGGVGDQETGMGAEGLLEGRGEWV
ncbi:hypothetical protein HYDPIDRAFT_33004 [Hydnomerulius pinastri MD-312]|uniref:Uncharacterized protein n=1 Tax=Hydnomerulius pinastri MD-312 TaxID=994086 RepID=A0A0C9W9R7_9AGAM|nr:hypothetical protein HYDPIDRAFT_33004 [Hydnomerulius pinastri MD-312]